MTHSAVLSFSEPDEKLIDGASEKWRKHLTAPFEIDPGGTLGGSLNELQDKVDGAIEKVKRNPTQKC